jgi:CubicO group peptidase (beta-lactamase class C family)
MKKLTGVFIAVLLFALSAGSISLLADTPPIKSSDGSDLFTVSVLTNGTVFTYKNEEQAAEIEPQIFTKGSQGWKYCPFEIWGKDDRFNGMATLPDGTQVGLISSVTLTPGSIHVLYRMIPLEDVSVIDARAAAYVPYDDWVGAGYQWGDQKGTVSREKGASNILAWSDASTDTLGPTLEDGLSLRWNAQGLHSTLEDNRKWTPNLAFTWNHHEPTDKPWIWKAGEEKDFDFSLDFNRDLFSFPGEVKTTSEGFEGGWCGFAENEDHEKYRIALNLEKNAEGKWAGRFSSLDEGKFNEKIKGEVVVDADTLRTESKDGNSLNLNLNASGQVMDGIDRVDGKIYEVHLRRGKDFIVPRLDSGGEAVTEYSYQRPQTLSDGWAVGDLSQSPLDPKVVEKGVIQILNQGVPHLDSLVIVQGGKLLLDEYFYGFGANDEHRLMSITKSVLSSLLGIAYDQGLLKPEQKLYDFFPEYRGKPGWTADKDKITLGMLLSMGSGFACDDYTPPLYSCLTSMYKSGDWLSYCLSQSLSHEPGTHFNYCNYCMIPLGAILAKESGLSVPDFAQKYLYDPLGIQAHHWQTAPNGITEVIGSHWLRPRDMAKLGYLYLKNGKWNGKQVISESWIRQATSAQAPEDHEKDFDYGYLWWEEQMPVGNHPVKVFYAKGHGGQYIFVAPDLDLVCVMTAGNYDGERLLALPEEFFKAYILGAFK